MTAAAQVPTLLALVEKISERAAVGETISIRTIQDIAGQRIAGPLLFFPAMVVVSPLSLIPTLPTITAVTVIVVAAQLVIGRQAIWLPKRIERAGLSPERVEKALKFLRPAAAWLDRYSRPRLTFLVNGLGIRLAALVCILVALTMPPLELVPGASTSAGTVIATFGLSLTTEDGALLLAALSAVLGLTGLLVWWLI